MNTANFLEQAFEAAFLPLLCRIPNRRVDSDAFADHTSERERDMLVIGTFYGLVGNSGVMGWVENGYHADDADDLHGALGRMASAGYPLASRVQAMLDELGELIGSDEPETGEGAYSEWLYQKADVLEDGYYAYADEFKADVHRYFMVVGS